MKEEIDILKLQLQAKFYKIVQNLTVFRKILKFSKNSTLRVRNLQGHPSEEASRVHTGFTCQIHDCRDFASGTNDSVNIADFMEICFTSTRN